MILRISTALLNQWLAASGVGFGTALVAGFDVPTEAGGSASVGAWPDVGNPARYAIQLMPPLSSGLPAFIVTGGANGTALQVPFNAAKTQPSANLIYTPLPILIGAASGYRERGQPLRRESVTHVSGMK